MTRYLAYLETADDGTCMAHVPGLPGCCLRATGRDEALQRLPGAVHEYHTWLHRHGAPAATAEDPVEIELAGEETGSGPFKPGDAAALFPPDREPISVGEMERYFQLMAYSRADLLTLVEGLPDAVLDWRPNPETFPIRRILRHLANAEQWYVSRIVPEETLPAEWHCDEGMPILEFLEMERRTAVERLRGLTETERSQVFRPALWTRHPDEPWTARKALRRFVEHEREHSGQVREILAARRRLMLAELAAARGDLLEPLLGLDAATLTQTPVHGDWTAKDVLVHIAGWDRWALQELSRLVEDEGQMPDLTAVRDLDAYNAQNVAAWRDRSLDDVIAELTESHAVWVNWMERLPEGAFFRRRMIGKNDWAICNWLEIFRHHDHEHAEQLVAWRQEQQPGACGPKCLLSAALDARRREMLAAAALVPPAACDTLPVCGVWNLRDLVGHIADWEQVGVEGLRCMAAGRAPEVEPVADIEGWNQAHAAARRDQGWEVAWADLLDTRRALLEIFTGLSQADLERVFPFPWGVTGSAYQWISTFVQHDCDHARDVHNAVAAPTGPAETPAPAPAPAED